MTNIVTKIKDKKFASVEESVKDKLTQIAGKKLVEMQEAVCKKVTELDDKDVDCGCDEDELDNGDEDDEEDKEKVEEISKQMIGRYVKKAKDDSAISLAQSDHPYKSKKQSEKHLKKFQKRSKNIDKAVDRLTK